MIGSRSRLGRLLRKPFALLLVHALSAAVGLYGLGLLAADRDIERAASTHGLRRRPGHTQRRKSRVNSVPGTLSSTRPDSGSRRPVALNDVPDVV